MNLPIAIYAESVCAGLATVVQACYKGKDPVMVFVPEQVEKDLADHRNIWPFFAQAPMVRLLPPASALDYQIDTLLVSWAHRIPYPAGQLALLRRVAAGAQRVVLLFDAQFGGWHQQLRQQWRMIRAEWAWLRKVERVCYMTVYPRYDFFNLRCPRFPLSVGPNVHYLFNAQDRQRLYRSFNPAGQRRFFLICTGAKQSDPWRAELADYLEARLQELPGLAQVRNAEETPPAGNRLVWWGLGGPRLELEAYEQLTTASDFVLCLPGTSWTHRPFEALVCGAIPIVDRVNLRLHDMSWADGRNCLVVNAWRQPAAWLAAIRRALAFSQEQIVSLRRHIQQLRVTHLEWDVYRERLRHKLAVDGTARL